MEPKWEDEANDEKDPDPPNQLNQQITLIITRNSSPSRSILNRCDVLLRLFAERLRTGTY